MVFLLILISQSHRIGVRASPGCELISNTPTHPPTQYVETNTLVALVGRAAGPHRPYPCEVANSVGILRELSWLTYSSSMAKVELDCKAAVLRSARLPRLYTAIGLT